MYLKAIEIQGFKSFPDKTRLTFGSDITAIVGPNGSGKSNISDAIRWVMGEMSSKALRGSKMEDVIFGGTLKRAQVGFAEVSLILDNTEQMFSVDGPEIMVTRRYYRSGDSEYYINRQTARLRDINELFMDTGLGKEGYSNIGQGRIDEILSAKSTDRREIFEEAAGISKYRHRKEETERKLQKTQENLLRINDKISELELQVKPLQEQAEKAKRYLILRDELRGLEITVWLRQLEKLSESARKAQEDYVSANFQLEQGKADLDELYRRTETMAENVRALDVETEHLRRTMSETESAAADQRSKKTVLEAKRQGNEVNIQRLSQEMEAQESRSGDIRQQIAERQTRIKEISHELDRYTTMLCEHREKLQQLQECRRQDNETLEILRQKQSQLLQQSAELRSGLSASDADVQKLLDRRREVQQRYEETTERRTAAQLEQECCRKEWTLWQEKTQELKNIINGYSLRAQGRIKKQHALEAQVSDIKIRLDTLKARIRMYREMEQSYEGYSKSIRIVMQEAEKGNLRHIHGPVSRLIQTQDDFTVAIETALGASMQSVVVDSEQDGKAAISLLRRREAGRATFLPLSVVQGRRLSEHGLEQESGFVGLASDLITYQSRYRDIMENLLGRTVIAEDMDSAIAIAGRHGHRFRIVTLDGQILNPGGAMTGGSTARSSGVLTRANELQRMEHEKTAVENDLQQATLQLQDAARLAAQAEAEIADAQNRLREAEDQTLGLGQKLSHYQVLLDALEETVETADRERETVEELLSGGEERKITLLQKSQVCDQQLVDMTEKISQAREGVERLDLRISELGEALHCVERSNAALEAEDTSAQEALKQLEDLVQALGGDRRQHMAMIERYVQENAALEQELYDCDALLEQINQRAVDYREVLQQLTQKRMEIEAGKTAAEKETQQKNRALMDMERECARLEQKKTAAQMEEKQILDKLWDSYELTHSTAMSAMVEIESVAGAQKRIGELRRKIHSLGHPNLGAIEEFQRVNERYEYLTSQRDDVEVSRRELQKIIHSITGEMTEIFKAEFDKINTYFGQTFTEMFGGGKAGLRLEDENDVLACGIEIKVQPPGKQLKNIMLLSGGEKAFVAIALYFAIMKVRPTPFCMLDEIDAALDDPNVRRFAAYLRTLSHKTQFIVITHRRGTMEAADVLYGVTMQEQGISKVLSVDLDQVTRELSIT